MKSFSVWYVVEDHEYECLFMTGISDKRTAERIVTNLMSDFGPVMVKPGVVRAWIEED